MELQIDYDKKEVVTEDGATITLYNKELLAEKKAEETENENGEEANTEVNTNEATERNNPNTRIG